MIGKKKKQPTHDEIAATAEAHHHQEPVKTKSAAKPCPDCGGRGLANGDLCETCDGHGTV